VEPQAGILLITRNLPPLLGGMERLNLQLAEALAGIAPLTVIGPRGCGPHLPFATKVIEVPARPLWRFLLSSSRAARSRGLGSLRLVVAGSGLAARSAMTAARRAGAPCVAYVHGLDLIVPHPVYRAFWLPQLRRLDLAIANSANTADLAARTGVARGRVAVVHPGVAIPPEDPEAGLRFRQAHGLEGRTLLLSVGRMTPRKGLAEFVARALPAIRADRPDVVLVVIGDEAPNALAGASRGASASLRYRAAELGLSGHLRIIGSVDDATLSDAYRAADLHVFPVRQVPGDVEGFGMVAIEAAAHGLPTVAFAVGGVPDAVAQGRSGALVPPEDYAAFARRVIEMVSDPEPAHRKASARAFAAEFAWPRFAERIRLLLGGDLRDDTHRPGVRRGHAVLDLGSRRHKAMKIERLLDLSARPRPIRMLEVGCGSGGIAHHFGTHPDLPIEVDAVDVEDSRQVTDGYRFTRVEGTALPFPDHAFDVVITNHVIEHVGDRAAQLDHLRELRRVLRPDGTGYLAVPNRWQVVEPHYKLAFLSWLPQQLRSPYLRLRNRGSHYDCNPLTVAEAERLLREAGFRFTHLHGPALRTTFELERPDAPAYRWLLRHLPDGLHHALRRVFPTLIYRLHPESGGGP
jgi:phosphatidylinositol alpha-1,6-mannosyltransferase